MVPVDQIVPEEKFFIISVGSNVPKYGLNWARVTIKRENRKLAFYNNIYNLNKRPPYVDICKFKADRLTVSKFRISAHSLAVERGRYSYIPKDKRSCAKCDTALIELHFFVFCPAYKKQRQELIQKLRNNSLNFSKISEHNIFYLLNSNSVVTLKAVNYIKSCQAVA